MRKFPRAGGAAISALTLTLTAGAVAFTGGAAAPARAAAASSPPPALSAIRPGHPIQVAGTRATAAPSYVTNSTTHTSSSNWAGYVAARSGTSYRFISAHFYVPYLNCAGVTQASPTYSSHWIGLDGFFANSNSVEQTGVLAACQPSPGSRPESYYAWYEKYPNPPVYPNITIHAGDSITASIYFNSKTKNFTYRLADGTNGQHFSINAKCPVAVKCLRSSAEAVSEAPSDSTGNLPLADFQAGSFTGVSITNTSGTEKGGISSSHWDEYVISQVSDGTNLDSSGHPIPAGTPLDTPTGLVSGASFDNYWRPVS